MKKEVAFLIIGMGLSLTLYAQRTSAVRKSEAGTTLCGKRHYRSLSGIYPHLAFYNNEGECGTGALVPWGGRLWAVTYAPHQYKGSSDKLYEIDDNLTLRIRKESIGGTPANRMIHSESNQLFIGPYAIKEDGTVRTIHHSVMPGRLTGNARHLTDPANKIYYGTMEEGIYEVDVHTLDVSTLYVDGNLLKRNREKNTTGPQNSMLPGVHGKGLYSGQGVMLFTNNGEGSKIAQKRFDVPAGVLGEWDGKNWKVVRRNQFTEVTGPGGIYGNKNPETDAIWATGWDHKSIILATRDVQKGWAFYRLPKASNTYDGAHGWNTEWPRIRNIGTEKRKDYLMTMHGMFWRFPETFSVDNTAGIRPRSAYLKVIGDFTRWNDRLVFGCDDTAQKEFLNKRKAKGGIMGPGQSNSNLWFVSPATIDNLGVTTANGAVWIKENVSAGTYSEPFLFTGWDYRTSWLKNDGTEDVTFIFEIDRKGNNSWTTLKRVKVAGGKAAFVEFKPSESGEWVRVAVDRTTTVTVSFNYTSKDKRGTVADAIFNGLAFVEAPEATGGLLYSLGNNRRALGVLAQSFSRGLVTDNGYYKMGEDLKLVRKDDMETATMIKTRVAIPEQAVTVEKGSVLIVDDSNRRWRLPLGNTDYTSLTNRQAVRVCREVSTERDLFNCHGTFYELPAENADGYAKIRPVASHTFRIHDYVSYRGLFVMTGIDVSSVKNNEHIIISDDYKAAVWAGAIDDLWKIGKPVGSGGPWVDVQVKAFEASDPYLIGHYDKKELLLSHQADIPVKFSVEIDATGNGDYMLYKEFEVAPHETFRYQFPAAFHARWIRFMTNKEAVVTTWLNYK